MIYKYKKGATNKIGDAFSIGDLDWYWYSYKEDFKLELAAKLYLEK